MNYWYGFKYDGIHNLSMTSHVYKDRVDSLKTSSWILILI